MNVSVTSQVALCTYLMQPGWLFGFSYPLLQVCLSPLIPESTSCLLCILKALHVPSLLPGARLTSSLAELTSASLASLMLHSGTLQSNQDAGVG